MRTIIAVAVVALAAGELAYADVVTRQNWIPTGNWSFNADEQIGDMWTFVCKGGTVSITVDTIDDNGDNTSRVDPAFWLFDGEGNLLVDQADNETTCSVPPACGLQCPQTTDFPCGAKDPHVISISSVEGGTCNLGGGYRLIIEAKDKKGASVEEKKLKLGGGPKVKLPKWLDPSGGYKQGPLLDDEEVPVDSDPLN